MEKGGNASNGLSTSDKKSSSNSGDVTRSMKMRSTEAFLSKCLMTGSIHKGSNLDRPFDGGTGTGGDGGGGSVGPTGSDLGGANEVLGNINRDDAYAPSSSCGAAAAAGNFAKSSISTNLQPFDMFPAAYSTAPYKSPGGMAATVGFPFTSAQWGELERQAMIYKYMMCSVPVPPELLFPLTKNYPAAAAAMDSSVSSLYNVRYSRNGDPEPGRCKRTDGKKWRCSRDVAPHQKYCERHLHRGRPRSRKPVEVKSNGESHKKTRLEQGRPVPLPSSATSAAAASQQVVAATDPPLLLLNPKPDASVSAVDGLSYKGANRELELMNMEAGMVNMNGDDQRWQLLLGPNMGFGGEGSSIYGSSPLFDHDYVEQQPPLNVFSYTNASTPGIEAPVGFIDAWSIDYNLNSSNNGNTESMNQGSHSPSLNLSMAMAVGNILDEGMDKVQLEGGIECQNECSSKNSNWLGPVSWLPFAQGGPLAEALQPGSLALPCANPASPHDSIGTPATTVSSPSGVLQRTLFSHSDSSVCNSPTFAAHASEVAFPRFNQMD